MLFEFIFKNEFGLDRYYPNSDDSKFLLIMMKRRSITKTQLELLKKAKWPVQIQNDLFESLHMRTKPK